ncbi:imidazole glycerol phosphate synthase subunit HisH [Thalassomonas sp. M1454]|uniref:imidazole glycerol phosphate synthase subunit HisH n=1 Tax=Thalassomonas sp. M1454 TaxID=2594477 RepID=UPI00117F7ADF|nr:imidazole glycerol phosphate synthase subunit HisH [Thalassomonas sp. M1454]TRX57135.1 imidazole glycerol phosphate synthase subunit HisH [Thalassomonas sp. M1454]
MSQNVTTADAVIIDTGCANISSLKFALERLGYQILVSADKAEIKGAKKVFLPGVGSAEFAMNSINERDLVDVIQNLTQPVLGICLGMQLMTEHSIENNIDTPCLNLIPGEIKRITPDNGDNLRLPHMGWNTLENLSDSPLFNGLSADDYFYFVHTYCAPINSATIAEANYGQQFSACLQNNNFLGVQFHPERSGKAGAKLLSNFMELC